MREHLLKVGVSGIRGVVGEFLTPSLACSFAQAFGAYVGAGRVVVGRDTGRGTPIYDLSPFLERSFALGAERLHLVLRAEAFNVLNHTVLGTPNASVNAGKGAFGTITTTASTERLLQFSVKLMF